MLAAHGTHAVVPIVGAVVAFLGAVHDAVTAVRRQLALRRAATIRAVQDAVVARLGPVLDTVATVRGVDAAGRAATIVTDIEECPVSHCSGGSMLPSPHPPGRRQALVQLGSFDMVGSHSSP